MPPLAVTRIVSGAQTGADRAALDVARALGIPCGGWVPKGRQAENGTIPAHYADLVEATSRNPAQRTAWNVRDSDATLILSHGPLAGGSLLTERKADALGRPCLHIDVARHDDAAAAQVVVDWLLAVTPATLNVAGPRASKDPAIYARTVGVLTAVFHGRS
ncbi:MAG: putative molybdenum carrier protein [bacterium]|nr:putative molybdenum carrier protein [bacterium]